MVRLDSINTRIKLLISELNLNPNSFSIRIGIQPQTLHHIISGRLTKPGFEIIQKILSTFVDINPDWLIHGNGSVFRKNTTKELTLPLNSTKQIPLVRIEAFGGIGNHEFAIEQKDIQALYVVPDFTNIDFMIRVKGSSMYPKYNSGDVVACRVLKEKSFIQWNKVHVVATKEQGILIKRIKKATNDTSIIAVSDNKDYDPFEIPWSQVDGIAIVVGVIRLE